MNREDATRAFRAVRLMHSSARVALKHGVGRAGASVALKVVGKANLILSVADAAISVADCVATYLELESARSETTQLLAQLTTDRSRLDAELVTLTRYVESEHTRIEDQRRIAEVGGHVRTDTVRLLDLLDAILASHGVQAADGARFDAYQRAMHQYEHVVEQHRALTDQLYG